MSVLDRSDVKRFMCQTSYALPLLAATHLVATRGVPSLSSLLGVVISTILDTSFCMSVLLHRFFAHRAFQTSRSTQLALAWLSCLAYQLGPLWWASKHRRHHKHCDDPKDPHSWSQLGWFGAWVGWTVDIKEQPIDTEFLGSLANVPELRTVDRLWFLPPAALTAFLYAGMGMHPAFPLLSMLFCRLVTLQFNCEYHPPDPTRKCKSVNIVRFFSEIVGESHHDDHHDNPSRAQRPGRDLAYLMFIRPLCALGLAWLPCRAS